MALKSGRVGIHPSQVDPITGMLIGGTGGASIDDTTIASDKTWSSQKINTELNNKQGTLTAGSNITIDNNVISSTASGGLLPELQITATTGSTVTATKGTTVITATEISSGLFTCEVPEFGTYTVSDGTDSTTVTVDTVKIYEVEIIPTPSVISVTLTLYSATEDQVTVVDEDGTHLEQFASGQSSKSITVKIAAAGGSVSFTSSVAKDPSDLTEYYSKTVTITSATTEVYCMPVNALYWYGNFVNFEDITSANGWNIGIATTASTHNTNSVLITNSNTSELCGVASKSKITDINTHTVYAIINNTSGTNRFMDVFNEKTTTSTDTRYTLPSVNTPTKVTYNPTMQNGYPIIGTQSGSVTVSALWYE